MGMRLTQRQLQLSKRFKEFANEHIASNADQFDRNERIPQELIRLIGKKGYLGGIIPRKMNGSGWDIVSYGLFCEEMGRVSASLLSLFTVHGMVSWAILKWGTAGQLDHWLPKLAAGQIIGAFALTEPEIGSDAKNIGTNASPTRNGYRIDGQKKWISCGQIADLFLVFAMCEGSPTAFLVEKTRPGLTMQPISGMLGFRSAMLSELKFNDCRIPKENLLGKVGFGFSHVVNAALDLGRYSIAWGSVGISQACTEACLLYTAKRTQFGVLLKEHQLVQQMIANMIVDQGVATIVLPSRLPEGSQRPGFHHGDGNRQVFCIIGRRPGGAGRCPNSWRERMQQRLPRTTLPAGCQDHGNHRRQQPNSTSADCQVRVLETRRLNGVGSWLRQRLNVSSAWCGT
jgi:glutaryl-CoA dehydrogenase (non-decarboxylating)